MVLKVIQIFGFFFLFWSDLFLENSMFILYPFSNPGIKSYLGSRDDTMISQFIFRDHVIILNSLCAHHLQNTPKYK